MSNSRLAPALIGTCFMLAACAEGGDPVSALLSSEPAESTAEASPGDTVAGEPPLPGSIGAAAVPAPPSLGPDTGTVVSRRINELRSELVGLRGTLQQRNARLQEIRTDRVLNAQEYHGIVAAINARLQLGTTPGNPILVSQLGEAQLELEDLSDTVSRLSNLANAVAADSSVAAFLLESVRAAYGLSGAVEEDHRQLARLEDEVNQTVVIVDRLLNDISESINRQTTFLSAERANLQTLQVGIANGELYGTSLINRAYTTAAPLTLNRAAAAAARSPAGRSGVGSGDTDGAAPSAEGPGRPLVVIRFNHGDPQYRQAVFRAVSEALDRRPDAMFDLLAVSPAAGDPANRALSANDARANAEDVRRTLIAMGLPAERVTVDAAASSEVEGNEVHLFVR